MNGAALDVCDLCVTVSYVGHRPRHQLHAGKRAPDGLIGEPGCGMTVTTLAIMGLLPDGLLATGWVWSGGQERLSLPEERLCRLRSDRLAMVF